MAQAPIAPGPAFDETLLAMTYDEWLAWSEGEGVQSEWVNGEVVVFMPPNTAHALLVAFLLRLLADYAEAFDLGQVIAAPFEMRLARSAREPDLLFVARPHLDRLTPERLVGPADLVVELISDGSVRRDRLEKFGEYATAGVPEYWLLDPRPGRHRADFHRLTDEGVYEPIRPDADGRYRSIALPGLWVLPEWLWQRPLASPRWCLAQVAPALFGPPPTAPRG